MEAIIEKIDTNIKYDIKDNDAIVDSIVSFWDEWNEKRKPQLDTIEQIEALLSTKEVIESFDPDSFDSEAYNKKFKKIRLKDSSIKRIFNTSVAHTYNSLYKNIENTVDVDVQDNLGESGMNYSAMQKESLNAIIRKARCKKEFRAGVENWYKKGEKITYINWTQIFANVRRKATIDFMGMQIPLNKWEYQKVLKYDGAAIKNLEPENVVFDPEMALSDPEKAFWVYRSEKTIHQILNNQNYKEFLTSRQIEELKEASRAKKGSKEDHKKDEFRIKDGKIEVLEAEGDFELKKDNGEIEFFPNMKICVIAGKYVAYFAYNPNVICSYIWCPYEIDPETGRGLSLLSGLISNSIATTETLNKINKAIGLSIYKCYLAKEGTFSDGFNVGENEIIKIQSEMDDVNINNILKELDFQTGINGGLSFLEYLKAESEEQTQRFKLSSGDSPKQARTLGENKMIMQGQNVIFSYENDKLIDQDIIPMFEKLGELQANFQDKDELIKYQGNNGEMATGIMDSVVRQANYTYSIMDSQTSTDKKMNNMEFVDQLLQKIAPFAMQTGQGIIDVQEVLDIIGTSYEQSNPKKLLKPPEPPPMLGGMNGQQPEAGVPNEQANPGPGMAGGEVPLQ